MWQVWAKCPSDKVAHVWNAFMAVYGTGGMEVGTPLWKHVALKGWCSVVQIKCSYGWNSYICASISHIANQ
jgi:hypothetical protein